MKMDEWAGCYREGWKGIITEESFGHPAKVSYSLAERIYKHLADEGWIQPESVILDPFGGIAGTALHCMLRGCHWLGVELEDRFAALGRENIARWSYKYRNLPGLGSAVMLHGDSRRLREVLACRRPADRQAGQCDAVVSSPPYTSRTVHKGNGIDPEKLTGNPAGKHSQAFAEGYGQTPGQLGAIKEGAFDALVSSPPYMEQVVRKRDAGDHEPNRQGALANGKHCFDEYGTTPGQLGAMKEGSFAAVVSSPPFLTTLTTGKEKWIAEQTRLGKLKNANGRGKVGAYEIEKGDYGTTPGQLGAMKEGAFAAVVSSPPYAAGTVHNSGQDARIVRARTTTQFPWGRLASGIHEGESYGDTPGQLGQTEGNNFWTASRDIVQQCYDLLSPGGHAVWVLKSFVRRAKIVEFPGQWRTLCESVGFVTLHEHRAMLVEETEHDTLFNGKETRKVERKSFFRRLHEAKSPHTAINWETVLCMVKG
jgi:hypothetical protein